MTNMNFPSLSIEFRGGSNLLKNQRGYTLVIVLLSIIIISSLGLMLAANTANTALQIKRTEQDMQAVHLAEMGIERYHVLISDATLKAQDIVRDYVVEERAKDLGNIPDPIIRPEIDYLNMANNKMEQVLKEQINEALAPDKVANPTIVDVNANHQYKVVSPNFHGDWEDENAERFLFEKDGNDFKISFVSKGNVDSQKIAELNTVFKVKSPSPEDLSDEVEFPPSPGGNTNEYTNLTLSDSSTFTNDIYISEDLNSSKNNRDFEFQDLYVKGEFSLRNNNLISVNGDAHINAINSMPNAELRINGALYLYDNIVNEQIFSNPGQSGGFICVDGPIHLKGNLNIKPEHVNLLGNNSCNSLTSQQETRGIHAKSVNYFYFDYLFYYLNDVDVEY